jgi:cation diffusion facilitator family transporter
VRSPPAAVAGFSLFVVESPRRIAMVSVFAAAALVAIKLVAGLASGSLGLVSEALHSGTDLVAALLTLFAVGVSGRPPDPSHPYGHGKAEHLAALAEAGFLVVASFFIGDRALRQLFGSASPSVDAAWYAIAVVIVVLAVDISRATVSWRASRRFASPALHANALHFGSDLLGSSAVLVGLALARAGHPGADSAAALLVAVLVLVAAARLVRENVNVLMDRDPTDAHETARRAIEGVQPTVQLRRLRMRQAAGRHFADVVIGVAPGAAVGQGHAAADAVEDAVQRVLPNTDVVVHVEPEASEAAVRERAHAAAIGVPRVREIHNLSVVTVDNATELSLHLKLPGELSLDEAHAVATEVERAIMAAAPEVERVQTHVEPLAEPSLGESVAGTDSEADSDAVARIVRELTGAPPRDLRFVRSGEGLVAHLTLALDPRTTLAAAHALASDAEARIRTARPGIDDVVVHTEP